mmetsp:Transcript_31326/g.48020  ORF Transcript_31326/g.48020 Transcript_31326/m.48020 type:complete len:701 (+) Transcript_31326:38-2140(+)
MVDPRMGKESPRTEQIQGTRVSPYLSAIGAVTSGYLYKGSSSSVSGNKNKDNESSPDNKESELNSTPPTDLSSDAELASATSSPTENRSNMNTKENTRQQQEEQNNDENLPTGDLQPPPTLLTNRVGSEHSAFSGTAFHRPVPIVNRTAHSFNASHRSHNQASPSPSPHAGITTAEIKFRQPIAYNRTSSLPTTSSSRQKSGFAGLQVNPEMAAAVYAQASPLARMRSNRAQEGAASADLSGVPDQKQQPMAVTEGDDLGDSVKASQNQNKPPKNNLQKQEKEKPLQTEDEIVAAKHRKWKRNLKRAKRKQRMRLDGDDHTSYTSGGSNNRGLSSPTATCGVETDKILGSLKGRNPLQTIEGFFLSRCGAIEDVLLGEEEQSVYSTYSSASDTDSDAYTEGEDSDADNSSPKQSKNQDHDQGIKDTGSEETPTYLPKGLSPARKPNIAMKMKERQIARQLSPNSPGKAATQNTINLLEDQVSTSNEDDDVDELEPETPDQEEKSGRAKVGIKDRHFIRAFIEEISTYGVKMIWHREQLLKEYSPSPTCKLFLKLGRMGSSGSFEPPRLVWDIENTDGTKARGSKIDLFDIDSLEKPTILQIQNYPFAVPGSSVFVRSNNGKQFLFEAPSDEEARRVIHGVRWMIARLAFNLIIGNREVSCELLDFRDSVFSMSTAEETMQSKAMNDISNQLVEKSVSPAV